MLLLGAILAGVALAAGGQPVRAQEVKTNTSLSLIPADAAFYAASLRNREQVEIFLKSNAYKTLRSLPLVKMAFEKAKMELSKPGGPLEMYKKFVSDESNKELAEVLLDAVSDDMFVYGSKQWGDFLRITTRINNSISWSAAFTRVGGEDAQKGMVRPILLAAQKDRELLVVPDLVFGFKLRDSKKAVAQLDRLHKMALAVTQKADPLKGKIQKKKVGGGTFVTVEVDGSLVPWEDANLSKFEDVKDEFKPLIDHLKKMTLAVSVGVKDDYLLVGLTSSTKGLERLGGKGKNVSEREEFAPLAKYASKRLTGISYASKEFLRTLTEISTENVESTIKQFKMLLAEAKVVPKERREAIARDLDKLVDDYKKAVRPPGGQMGFSFLTDTGYEGFDYDYSNHDHLKGVNLHLHNHFGGNPIFAAAFACKVDGAAYKYLVWIIKAAHGHLEAILLDMVPPEAKEAYEKFAKEVFPVVKRIDGIIAKQLIPSMKESGLGIVIDAKWKSKQWVKELPALPQEMPMLELGLLVGISDAKGFQTAVKDLRLALNELWEKFRSSVPDGENIPEFKIPAPEVEKGKAGNLYYYPLPDDFGLDKQFLPVAGVGKRVSLLALSKGHANRLLTSTPLKMKEGPLARKDLIGCSLLNWPALVDSAAPWVEHGVKSAIVAAKDDAEGAKKAQEKADEVLKQVRVGLDVLRCFKGSSNAVYLEEGKLISHVQITVKDLAGKD